MGGRGRTVLQVHICIYGAFSLMKRVVFFVWYRVSFMWNGRLEFLILSAGEGIFGGYSS